LRLYYRVVERVAKRVLSPHFSFLQSIAVRYQSIAWV